VNSSSVLPGLTYDCRANDRDVQGSEAGALANEEIQDSDPNAQPDTPGASTPLGET